MKKRHLLAGLLVLLLVVALTAVACGGADETTTTAGAPTDTTAVSTDTTAAPTETTVASTEPIKVGHIVDITGFEANVGAQFKAALDYAFTNVEVAGRPVELITEDSKSEVASAVDAAKKLVEQDGVVAIFGPTQIGQKSAVAEYCKTAGVPLILYNPTPLPAIADNKWVIASGGTVAQAPTVIADYMYNELGYRSIVTLGAEDSGGHAFLDPLTTYFTALGGTVAQQQWTASTEDYTPYLTTLEDADALVAWQGGSAGIALLSQYLELGIDKKMPLVATYHGGFTDPWVINTIAKSNPEGVAGLIGIPAPMAWDPNSQTPVNQAFISGITPLLPYGPPGDDGYACPVQAAQLFMVAAEATAANLTPATLRDALLAADITGPEGREFFAPGDQAATKDFYVVKVQKLEIPNVGTVYNYATAKTYEAVPPAGLAK
jgi:ABC-type branched-subunit amino acid transport system substrate-binding protein